MNEQKQKELRERFGVYNGQFFAEFRFKNLNWYLNGDWFCFGDIRDEDITRIIKLLKPEEDLVLGWKDLPPNCKKHNFFGDGGGVWLHLNQGVVIFDRRRDLKKGGV